MTESNMGSGEKQNKTGELRTHFRYHETEGKKRREGKQCGHKINADNTTNHKEIKVR